MKRALILITTLFISTGYAFTIELLQLAVIGRYADFTDVLLSGLGVLAGIHLIPIFRSVKSVHTT